MIVGHHLMRIKLDGASLTSGIRSCATSALSDSTRLRAVRVGSTIRVPCRGPSSDRSRSPLLSIRPCRWYSRGSRSIRARSLIADQSCKAACFEEERCTKPGKSMSSRSSRARTSLSDKFCMEVSPKPADSRAVGWRHLYSGHSSNASRLSFQYPFEYVRRYGPFGPSTTPISARLPFTEV